jgi:hypothetical protein
MEILFILHPLDIFHGHLVYFVVIWYILPRFGISYREKSGNPARVGNSLFFVADRNDQKVADWSFVKSADIS